MLRVLVGGFGEVPRLGIGAILRPPDFVIDEYEIEDVMNAVAAIQPDALVLDSGPLEDLRLATGVATAYPAVTVVACSSPLRTRSVPFPARAEAGGCPGHSNAAALLECVRS